jgi:acyl-CoA reductase-like NAD-dependent aldehyde dehydrogenase
MQATKPGHARREVIAARTGRQLQGRPVDAILRRIIGNLHVSASNRTVIRHVVARLKGGYQGYRQSSRAQRGALLRRIIKIHADNRKLYVAVMSGRLGGTRKRRKARVDPNSQPG